MGFTRYNESKPMKIKKEEYAYLAGAIDCDGCIGINKTTRRSTKINKKNPIYNLYVRIVQKDKRILRFCYKTFGGHLYKIGRASCRERV